MKICHVISSLEPRIGGPVSVVTGLAAAQAALNHEVWIVTNPGLSREGHLALRNAPGLDKVSIAFHIGTTLTARITRLRQSWATKRIVSGCDVVHLHGVWDAILWMAATVARRAGTIYAVTPHGMLDPWSLSQKRWKKKLALRLRFGRMLGDAAILHLLNIDEERHVKSLLPLARQMVVIPNGIPPADIARLPAHGAFYQSHPALNSKPFILFLGRLHHKKGLDHLINAFFLVSKKHADIDLVIAGPECGELNNIKKRIGELALTDRVHLVGPLYGQSKFAALTDATVFCLPSRQEGFSMSIIEALACRLPVVISPYCHFNEVAEAGAGEVVELDPKAIAGALSRLVSDASLRHQAGEAGRALVLDHFTWPEIAVQTIKAYALALARK